MLTLIDFAAPTAQAASWRFAFGLPVRVLAAREPHEVLPVLEAVQAEAEAGRWCVGYVRYEAADAFDRAFDLHAPDGPLAWFGVHEAPQEWPVQDEASSPDDEAVAEWGDGLGREAFDQAMVRIHGAIAEGQFYQVNFTHALQGLLRQGTPLALFHALRRAQPGGYAAYIDGGAEQVLSVSPELFFDWDGQRILTRPMKGTAPRGATPEQDEVQADRLRRSAKERAENVMIVDLLRNDLSRVAQPHTVRVPHLFHLEALPSVWQMTSDVEAQTRPGTTLAEVFTALFPCGSVTGAPKVQAMRMIRELEAGPRGVYCGAIGVVRPGGAARFNVAIRTVEASGTALRCGIGSGITADARASGEWQEWRHKRAFLDRASQPFELLETLALQDGITRNEGAHLARMARAAAHFSFPWDEARVTEAISAQAREHPEGLWRLRVLLDVRGQARAQAFAMVATAEPVRLRLATRPFEAADSEFVRYKTTRRAHYEAFEPDEPGVFDTLLWNRHGELTECTRGNIALCLDGQWWTPPLASGLLGGIGRELALQEGRLQEKVLRVDDLGRASAIAFINSLRGWLDASLA